jgi:hypothetical protein
VLLWGRLGGCARVITAYLTQLRLYYEERARHTGKPFGELHPIGIGIATVLVLASASAFGAGWWIAASGFAKTTL